MRRYLQLTADAWQDWAGALRAALPQTPPTPAGIAAALTTTLVARPLFCDLLAQAPLSLERHVSLTSVRAFKIESMRVGGEIGELLDQALPGLGRPGARKAIAAIGAIAAAFWQVSHPPETLAQVYRENPELGHTVLDFAGRLENLTSAVLTGLLR